jgi:flagellar motor protein MotB
MSGKAKKAEPSGEKVPLWIISFADMITLLLSFFVMLQTMAHSKDSTLFGVSQDSFRRAISGFGMPDFLYGKQAVPNYDYRKLKYPTDEAAPDEPTTNERIIDANDEQIRHIFGRLQNQMESSSTDVAEKTRSVSVTPIRFARGSTHIDEAGQKYLNSFAESLLANAGRGKIQVYVYGLAPEETNFQSAMKLSSLRARSIEMHLKKTFAARIKDGTMGTASWGAQPGQETDKTLGSIPKEAHAIIVITEAEATSDTADPAPVAALLKH